MPAFTPTGDGTDHVFNTITAPLEAVRDKVTVVTNMRSVGQDLGADEHSAATGSVLTCVPLDTDAGVSTGNAISVDQVIANAIGSKTRFPSLELGSEAEPVCDLLPLGDDHEAYCAYAWNISWSGPGQPNPKQVAPADVFERLFGAVQTQEDTATRERRLRYRQSVLDVVLGDVARLEAQISVADRHRLDQYMTAIREVESSLSSSPIDGVCASEATALAQATDFASAADGREQVRQMRELMVLALQCDQTRVITYMLGNAASNRPFPWLGINDSHHVLSHFEVGQPYMQDDVITAGAWQVEEYVNLLQRLDAIDDGDGASLLDNSVVMYCSGMGDGNWHLPTDLPIILGGGCGGRMITGQHVLTSQGRPHNDLMLAILEAMGVPQETFGIGSTGTLTRVLT